MEPGYPDICYLDLGYLYLSYSYLGYTDLSNPDTGFSGLAGVNIYNLINEFDNRLFNTIKEQIEHPLYNILPRLKVSKHHLRKKSTVKPKINTECFKGTFINRLVFSNLGIFN